MIDRQDMVLDDALNEGFAWFRCQMTDEEINDGAHAFLKIRWTFQVAFLKGILWAKRQAREAKLPRK